jgi:hypothetical protein
LISVSTFGRSLVSTFFGYYSETILATESECLDSVLVYNTDTIIITKLEYLEPVLGMDTILETIIITE